MDDRVRPNVILLMSDEQGWGDVGFNGNNEIKTPYLDEMASAGLRFNRFYAASSLCSPTRGSCLTGRNPFRYGILAAHTGGMRVGEITIAELLKKRGYSTGMFGKWHIGWVAQMKSALAAISRLHHITDLTSTSQRPVPSRPGTQR